MQLRPALKMVVPSLLLCVGACTADESREARLEALADTTWEIVQVQQAIMGGQVDNLNTAVVGMFNTAQGGMCSGTLIAPNLVLTAQHCVAEVPSSYVRCGQTEFGSVYSPDSFFVTTDTTFSMSGNFYRVDEIQIPLGSRDLCGADIALMILSSNVPDSIAVPHTPRVDITATAGENYTAHGYGDTNGAGEAGTRRWLDDREVFCDGADCQRFVGNSIDTNEWIGSDGTCQGDSGGPALDEFQRVFGVLSRGGEGCTTSTYSDVQDWGFWIRDIADIAADMGGYDPPPWVVSGDSDPFFADADLDGIQDDDDNCLDVENTEQVDSDTDGMGDACDPIDNRDRGGACLVCNGCSDDADCGDGACVNFGDGGVCTIDCQSNDQCPASTQCFAVPDGANGERSLCLNSDAAAAGVCNPDWICGGEVVRDPATACDVCEPCVADSQCVSGSCIGIGNDISVCSAECESDTDCAGDARCFDARGAKFCFNPDAAEIGICHDAYICDDFAFLDDEEEEDVSDVPAAGTGFVADDGKCSSARTPGIAWAFASIALLALRRRR
ncbi:MAG: hypothetical protein ACJAYU_002833 [Bradymonadia bacterium]|jgi:hypothetical protein